MSNIPHAESTENKRMRQEYGIAFMKYGAQSLTMKEGMTSARRTTPFGTSGPTRSRAAERITT